MSSFVYVLLSYMMSFPLNAFSNHFLSIYIISCCCWFTQNLVGSGFNDLTLLFSPRYIFFFLRNIFYIPDAVTQRYKLRHLTNRPVPTANFN